MQLNRTAVFAFLAVYIVWGSTYLAIRYAIETIPAWSLTTSRFFVAAFLMALISLLKKEKPLSKQERQISLLSGIFLVLANGTVCVVEYWVPSGIVAVVVGAMPIWIMFLGWLCFQHGRPSFIKILGALIGLSGVVLIASGSKGSLTPSEYSQFGILILCVSSLLWSVGTLLQRKVRKVSSGFRFSAYQMLSGAVSAGLICLIFEKPWAYDYSTVSSRSIMALIYLIFFGSVIGFTAYSWLSRNIEPHLVSTYALVNPIIAVGLGWLFYDEPLTKSFIGATLLVVLGIALLMKPSRNLSKS